MIILFLLLLLLYPSKAFASTVTVCDSGNACDYSTMAAAITGVGTGNHTINVRLPYTANERVLVNKSGEGAGRELKIKAGSGQTITTRGFGLRRVDYVIIEGFDITGDWGAGNAGIDVYSSNHCIIKNNRIHNPEIPAWFIYLRNNNPRSTNCRIENNEMLHDGRKKDKVVVVCYGSNHLFEGNSIHDVTGDAFYFFGNGHVFRSNIIYNANQIPNSLHVDMFQTFGDNKDETYDIIIERNFMYNCHAQLFFMTQDGVENIRDITFRNNIWYNISMAGQTFVPRTYFYNNTIYKGNWKNGSHAVMYRSGKFGAANRGKIKNNIFVGCGNNFSAGWYSIGREVSEIEKDYNFVSKDSPGFGDFSRFTGTEAHGISGADPRFVDLFGRDLHLKSGSPAINKGINLSFSGFSDDKDGFARPKESGWDIGAYEFRKSEVK